MCCSKHILGRGKADDRNGLYVILDYKKPCIHWRFRAFPVKLFVGINVANELLTRKREVGSFDSWLRDFSMDWYLGQTLIDASGASIPADSVVRGRRVLALYFSAHWCPPCRGFTPMLKRAFEMAQTSNTAVIFVSSDRSIPEQLEYMRQAHGNWPAVRAGSELAQ